MIELVIVGAFFCYGIYTLQRKGFLLEKLTSIWKKLPVGLHEPLFACGICVSSFWGTLFIVSQFFIRNYVPVKYQVLVNLPVYIIAMCGICAVVDRAVKFFEFGYGYNKPK